MRPTRFGNLGNWSPASTCYGWTCTGCGYHSISAVGPVPNCAKCHKPNPARVLNERDRKSKLAAKAKAPPSEPKPNLPPGAERKAAAL